MEKPEQPSKAEEAACVGQSEPYRCSVLHAGDYDDEQAWNGYTDKVDPRKIKVECPGCKRIGAPLCSTKTRIVDQGMRWVGCDHREPYGTWETTCRCGQRYTFTTYTPQ